MIKEIPLNGYTAQPSDFISTDGELAVSINALPENGGLKQVNAPKMVKVMPYGSKILSCHKGVTFTNYIVLLDSQVYWMDANGTFSDDNGHLLGTFRNLSHSDTIGNTLILFDDNIGVSYFLFQSERYVSLGTKIPYPEISFGLKAQFVNYAKCYPEEKADSSHNIPIELPDTGVVTLSANKKCINDFVATKTAKMIKEQITDKNTFTMPFFVRYALRLYDGSLIMHSAPILMVPSSKGPAVVLTGERRLTGSEHVYYVDIYMVQAVLDACLLNVSDIYPLNTSWKDIVKSVDVFVSAPVYPYSSDGDCTLHYDTANGLGNADMGAFVGAFRSHIATGNEDFREQAGGEGVFVATMEHSVFRIRELLSRFNSHSGYIELPYHSEQDMNRKMISASQFYLVKSIPISKLLSDYAYESSRRIVKIDEGALKSLQSHEPMTDDYLSHDKLMAGQSYVYNSRLNLTQVKRSPFCGFNPSAIFAYVKYAKMTVTSDSGGLNLVATGSDTDRSYITAEVYIRENGYVYKVQSEGIARQAQFMTYSGEDKAYHYCFVYYPNPNAFMMRITETRDGTQSSITFDLVQHDFLNGACAFFPFGQQRTRNYTVQPSVNAPSSFIDMANRIYTSEVNNPFVFNAANINSIGSGRIIGITSATKALSQGQFGQFPLYAFTTEGVWALEVSSSGSYSAKQPITRDIVLGNGESLTQLDNAVLFATNRGIMLISGSQSVCISGDIDDKDSVFDISQLPRINEIQTIASVSVPSGLSAGSFREFIKECRMVYDYANQRVIVYNPTKELIDNVYQRKYTYAYVYSLITKKWGMMLSDITSNFNSYPDALAQDGNHNIINLSLPIASADSILTERKLFIVTRPFKLDLPHVLKTIRSIIVRGIFRRGNVSVALYASRDLLDWVLVSSSTSHHIRSISGTPFRYFRLVIIAKLSLVESLHSFTVDYEPRMTNRQR